MKFEKDKAFTRAEGLSMMLEQWQPVPKTELVPLTEAIGRVTACDVFSKNDMPIHRVSSKDGLAVKSAAFAKGNPDTSKWELGVDYVHADTGDDFPDEFDSVIVIEQVTFDKNHKPHFPDDLQVQPGDGIRKAGTMLKKGELLVHGNSRITPELAVALGVGGIIIVPVKKTIRVAFIPTGNELVPLGVTPDRGQTVETNGLMLSGLLKEWGAETICFPIVRDNKKLLENAIDEALKCADLVLINGGTSRGSEDYNCEILEQRGSFFRHGVKAVPGRPVGIAIINDKPVVNVPGPIAAAWLCSDWLVKGLVYHYYGLPVPVRPKVKAKSNSTVRPKPGYEYLARVKLKKTEDGYTVTTLGHGKTVAESMREVNGFMAISSEGNGITEGEEVEVELL